MNQQLQGQGAAYDGVAPGTVVAALPETSCASSQQEFQRSAARWRSAGRRRAGRREPCSTTIAWAPLCAATDLPSGQRLTCGSPASKRRRRGPPGVGDRNSQTAPIWVRLRPYPKRGSTLQRIATSPERPSIERASSRVAQGRSVAAAVGFRRGTHPAGGAETLSQQVAVVQGSALDGEGVSRRKPKGSAHAQHRVGPRRRWRSPGWGRQSQSIDPSRATKAAIRPSPITPVIADRGIAVLSVQRGGGGLGWSPSIT